MHLINAARSGLFLAACLLAAPASASVVIATTRVVFPAQQQEVTVKLSNEGNRPALVQAWVDDGRRQAKLEELQVPFSLAPALFRLDAGKGQSLRIFHSGEAMAQDRESLFWLNVLDVPPKGAGSFLQFSVRSRIKLLYRPLRLPGRPENAHQRLVWQLSREGRQWVLQASNPGAYYVNLASLDLHQPGKTIELQPQHIPPYGGMRFAVVPELARDALELRYSFIDDHGAVRQAPAIVPTGWNG